MAVPSPGRTLTRDNVFRTIANAVRSGPELLAATFRPRTSTALREKVMLAVTAVNECRLCAWGHGHWARAYGVPLEEVNAILGQQAGSLQANDPAEAAALLFAQQYAEENGEVDPESIGNLRRHYDERQVAEILAYVRAITLGNLLGNTLDAIFGRAKHGDV